jgi:hypothetical protein
MVRYVLLRLELYGRPSSDSRTVTRSGIGSTLNLEAMDGENVSASKSTSF